MSAPDRLRGEGWDEPIVSGDCALKEAAQLAQNLARNCGYAVFPVRRDKAPATPHGFKDAITDPAAIAALWRRYPGPLIGIATGERSGVSVLDIDVKHDDARGWWHRHASFLPSTRAYRTRSGGVHLFFQPRPGVTNKARQGVDVRGEGGFIIWWFAAGLECLDHTPPAPWPDWLFAALFPPPAPPPSFARGRHADPDTRLDGLLRSIAAAPEGERNSVLFWAACRAGDLVRAGDLGHRQAEAALLGAARAAGFAMPKSAGTIRSGLGRAA